MLVALDTEFTWPVGSRPFDYTCVEPICAAVVLEDGSEDWACPAMGRPFSILRPYLQRSDLTLCAHHSQAEWKILRALRLPVPQFFDTEAASRYLDIRDSGFLKGRYDLLNCMRRAGLPVRENWLKAEMQARIARRDFSDPKGIVEYCLEDTRDTLKLALLQGPRLDRFWPLISDLHRQLLEIYDRGLCLDVESYTQLHESAEILLCRQQRRLKDLGFQGCFESFEKLTSPRQNIDVQRTMLVVGLNDILDQLPVFKKDEDRFGWQRRSMAGLFKSKVHRNRFLDAVYQYHSTIDLLRYDWRQFIDSDGRIRFGFAFPGSSSYRISPRAPHPLMLPKIFRPILTAAPGFVIVEIDFSCQEFGLAGAWFNDERMIRLFNNYRLNLYAESGLAMGCYPSDDPADDPEQLDRVKVANLSMIYGAGVPALRENLQCAEPAALNLIRSFRNTYPGLFVGRERYLDAIRLDGYAWNVVGLQRCYQFYRLTDLGAIDTTLSYLNYPIQSSASMVMAKLLHEMPEWIRIVATCHDAILIEAPADAVRDVVDTASAVMRRANDELFPQLRCRVKSLSAFRYHKSSTSSLHDFCRELGVELTAPVEGRR